MTELNQSPFPYQIDKIVSNPHCLGFIRSFIDYEEFGKLEDMINKINSTPDLKEKYGDNINKVSRVRRKFNLNLGFYSPGKKSKGQVIEAPEVTLFFNLFENSEPEQVKLGEHADNKPDLNGQKKLRRLAPSVWSMKTANYTNDRSGISVIIPNNITAKSKMIEVYCGYSYGQMMGHGNWQIWRRSDSGWTMSSTKGSWIS